MKFHLLTAALLVSSIARAGEPDAMRAAFQELAGGIAVESVAALPALNNGRLKPLHTVARETSLYLTGSYGFWNLKPLELYLGLAVFPEADTLRLIEVRDAEVRERLGLELGRRYFSVSELKETPLSAMVQPLMQRSAAPGNRFSAGENALIETYHQISVFESIRGGGHLLSALDRSAHVSASEGAELHPAVRRYLMSLVDGNSDPDAVSALTKSVSAQAAPAGMDWQLKNMRLEIFFNNARLFFWTALGYLAVGILSFFVGASTRRSRMTILGFSLVPILLHIAGLAIRVQITGFAPVTNMYGTMIWVGLGMSLFTLMLYYLYGQPLLSGILWAGAAGLMLLTESLPLTLSPDLDPVVAVLRSNFWLTTHVLTITISYSAFTLAMVIGNVALVRSVFKANDESFTQPASHLCYRLIQLGVFLITAGIILGGVWADYSWGRFWGWDPKETWALIVALGYLAILHGRHAGHISRWGLLVSTPAAYLLVIMAWYGVNFILATGLHSYGFSSGGTRMIVGYLALQAAFYLLPLTVRAVRSARTKKAVG